MQLFTNNAASTLASGITDADTSLTLVTGEGARFPTITGGDWFMLTLTQLGTESTWEIVKVTARAGDVLTVVRAQDGTTAAAWSATSKAELRLTASFVNTVDDHMDSTSNPHSVTKTQVGLDQVDNTSDANKPVSTAQQTALNLKANLDSPALTGTPTAPTATTATDTTQLATTAFVNAAIASKAFPSGTKMLFQQTAAPTGWTKDTTHNDKALRVVSGTAGSGGTVAFATTFSAARASSTVTTSGTVGSTTLTTTQIPAHKHLVRGDYRTDSIGIKFGTNDSASASNMTPSTDGVNTGTYTGVLYGWDTGGGGSHNHSLTMNAHYHDTNLNVQYVDLIIATKD